jgi:hypothetical protein
VVLAGIVWWRAHPTAALLFGSVGAALAGAALIVPTHLGPVERGWMGLAQVISRVTTPVVMGVMYMLVLTPFGLVRRAFGKNPLVHAESTAGFWKPRMDGRRSASMERQF